MGALGRGVDRRRDRPLPLPHPGPAEAGTAALLHDFGKVVLAKHFGNQILDTLALAAANDGLEIVEAERVVFGLTHAEIGGTVAEVWGLPLTIVDGIRDHHEAHEGLSAVSAAVGLACTMSFEITAREETPEELDRQGHRRLAASPQLKVLAARLRRVPRHRQQVAYPLRRGRRPYRG